MAEHERLSTEIFPEAVKAGSFGTDVEKFVGFKARGEKIADQFCSGIIFGDVMLEKTTGELFVQPVVIKTNLNSCKLAEFDKLLDFNGMFHNEVLFYKKIVPLLRKYDKDNFLVASIPELVYGKATYGKKLEDDFIILKDLNQKGFKLTDDKLYLDEKHLKLALNRIAKFHGLSLECQIDNPEGLNEVVSQIKGMIAPHVLAGSFYKKTYNRGLDRSIKALKEDPKYKEKLAVLHKYIESVNSAGDWVIQRYLQPQEPLELGVIAHGDFQRSNMMFKYATNGDPVEVVFFDFALVKVCSPAVDFSIPLSINVTSEVRSSHWDELLTTYYDALSHQLDAQPKKPSFGTVKSDLLKNGVYGYFLASHIVPNLMAFHNEAKTISPTSAAGNTDNSLDEDGLQSLERTMTENGGAKATEMLVSIVKHMLDKNYTFKS